MLSLTFIVVFVFCAAIVTASILVGHQFIATYNTEFHRNYFYYLVAFFSFAFYSIWAPIIMQVILASIGVDGSTVKTVTNFLPVLGVPFLVISWYMLVKMGFCLVAKESRNRAFRIYASFLAIIFAVVTVIYFLVDSLPTLILEHPIKTEIAIFAGLELGFMLLFAAIVRYFSKSQKRAHKKIVIRFVLLMLLAVVLRVTVLPFTLSNPWIVAPLILVYFISNFVPLFYLKLHSHVVFTPLRVQNPKQDKRELLYRKFEISKREKEIIEQICLGKTNQQIADALFISLQTVKDHTHRIYTKVGIKNRMKLMQMLNG